MQNWAGAAFIALTVVIVGVQVGRKGPAGAFRPVPLILVLCSFLLLQRLRAASGFTLTATHIGIAVALLIVGVAIGRMAGPPRPDGGLTDADRRDAEMYRRAGMTPMAIDSEMKYRRVKREIAGTEPWVHADAGFALVIPPTWQRVPMQRGFAASGGRLAIAHVTGHATLNVSCGALDDPRFADAGAREETLRRIATESGYAEVAIGRPEVSGEVNVVRGDWLESDGGRAGLMSIVHDGTETVLQWKAGPDYTAASAAIVDSFRLL